MIDARLHSMAQKLADRLLDYGPSHSPLLRRVMHRLANCRPVTRAEVDKSIAELGLTPDEAWRFLQKITERDAEGQIVGIMGLSLSESPHRLHVNGVRLSAWCAEDTLFLPAMLQQTATVESRSPVSGLLARFRRQDLYQVTVRGCADRLQLPRGFRVRAEHGTTVIAGPVEDHKMLYKLIDGLRDGGFPLLSVSR